jgi:hypothetical protein
VSHEALADSAYAFNKLPALVSEQNAQAEERLVQIARASGRGAQLAGLYVKLAQTAKEPELIASYWQRAADAFDRDAGNPEQALEAALRRLAVETKDRDALAQVDRLGSATRAYKRLSQVYDRLVRDAGEEATKVDRLVRHANLGERGEPNEALDRLLRAFNLAPDDDELLTRVEELAARCKRGEELLAAYDRRRSRAGDDATRVDALLRAARLCDVSLRDRERANALLASALPFASSPELHDELVSLACDMDDARPELGADQARRALIRAHRQAAERSSDEAGTELLLRASELLRDELGDDRGALDMLRQGLALRPLDESIYDAFCEAAAELRRLDAVDAHLEKLANESIDQATTSALLRWRARLLGKGLERPQDSATVYARLLQLRPDDPEATEKLRASLRADKRYQDLLVMLDRQLHRTKERDQRLVLLKEIARTWERDLKNRWEALDAWKAVLALDPDDARTSATVARLERGRGSSPGTESSPPADAAEEPNDAIDAEAEEAPAVAADMAAEGQGEKRPRRKRRKRAKPAAVADGSAAGAQDTQDTQASEDEAGAETAGEEPRTEGKRDRTRASATTRIAEPADDTSESDDLAALDAGLAVAGAGVDELDLLSEPDVSVDVDLDEEVAASLSSETATPKRLSAPPPPPRRVSAPPRPPTSPGTTRAQPPPLPRASVPPPPGPPVPSGGGRMSAPPPPPPLPPRKG